MSLIVPGRQYVSSSWTDAMVASIDAERVRGLWWLEPHRARGPLGCTGYALRMTAARSAAARERDSEEARVTIETALLDERERELRARGLDWETASMQAQYEAEGS